MATKNCDDLGGIEATAITDASNPCDPGCPPTVEPCPRVNPCATPANPCATPAHHRTIVVPQSTAGGSVACGPTTCPPNQPFYQTVRTCPEDNRQTVIVRETSQVFKSRSAFCIPACGARVRVVFDDVVDVAIGAWLWSYGLGFLEITGFNPYTHEVELENPCPDSSCQSQAAPGTPVPACTVFVLSVPPCSQTSVGGDNTFPFLASGFVAPVADACIDISLTNVNGISINKNISINGGIYRVSAIKSATLVTICNDGQGLTPGTVVNYSDNAGNLITPIILIDSNPCNSDAVLSGVPLVCSSGTSVPLEGSLNGQFLVWNGTTGKAEFQTVNVPILVCSPLINDLTLNQANPPGYEYSILVADNTDFGIGTTIEIIWDNITYVFSVDAKAGSNLIAGQLLSPALSSIVVIERETAVCEQSCCVQLQSQIDIINDELANETLSFVGGVVQTDNGISTINSGAGTSIARSSLDIVVTNPNPSRNLAVTVTARTTDELDIADGVDVVIYLERSIDGGAFSVVDRKRLAVLTNPSRVIETGNVFYVYTDVLIPGQSHTYTFRARLFVFANPTNASAWNNNELELHYHATII